MGFSDGGRFSIAQIAVVVVVGINGQYRRSCPELKGAAPSLAYTAQKNNNWEVIKL